MTFKEYHEAYFILTALPFAYFIVVSIVTLLLKFVFEDAKGDSFCEKMFFSRDYSSCLGEVLAFDGFCKVGCGGWFISVALLISFYYVGVAGFIALGVGIGSLFLARFVVRLNRKLKVHMEDKQAHQ